MFSRRRKAKRAKFAKKFGRPPIFEVKYPSFIPQLALFLLIAAVLFLLAGGLYMVVKGPPLLISLRGGPAFMVPGQIGEQTLAEGILFMFFLTLGVAGGYMAYHGLRENHRLRRSSLPLAVGIILFALGLFGAQMLLQLKIASP